jgi:ankyrin repeat protein
MGAYGAGARYVLGIAVERNDIALARWALDHGATPNPQPFRARVDPANEPTLLDGALRRGYTDMATLLAQRGATRSMASTTPTQDLVDACLHLDLSRATQLLQSYPGLLTSPAALHTAAALDRADAVAFILDLGVSPNVPDSRSGNQLALHVAAWADAPNALQVLVDRGGDVDRRDDTHGGTPLGFAVYGNKVRAIEVLKYYGNDVWNLAIVGAVDRLRDALSEHPALATAAWPDEQITALMRLPGDPSIALEIAKLLLAHGANPQHQNSDGLTAIDLAERRGLHDVVALLRGV